MSQAVEVGHELLCRVRCEARQGCGVIGVVRVIGVLDRLHLMSCAISRIDYDEGGRGTFSFSLALRCRSGFWREALAGALERVAGQSCFALGMREQPEQGLRACEKWGNAQWIDLLKRCHGAR